MIIDDASVLAKIKGKQSALPPTQTDNLPWVEKYRPVQLDDLISHKDIISTITKFIDENRLPHLLLYGPPGTGKTSTILACARKLYGSKYKSMILELNASDDRGIDIVRDQIKTFASSKAIFSSGYKLIILDEADNMTQIAQNALRRIIEKYTKNVRFCLICNYVGKIIPALQSRCTRFRFSPLKEEQIKDRLDFVVRTESVGIDEPGRKALMKLCQGDMRRVLNILQSAHAAYGKIDEDVVYRCTGSPLPSDMAKILDWLLTSDFTSAMNSIQKLKTDKGLALSDLIIELYWLMSEIDIPVIVRVFLIDKLAEIEYNLSNSCSEKIQVASLVGSFKIALELAKTNK
jgi:replication factor C subunit 3/5